MFTKAIPQIEIRQLSVSSSKGSSVSTTHSDHCTLDYYYMCLFVCLFVCVCVCACAHVCMCVHACVLLTMFSAPILCNAHSPEAIKRAMLTDSNAERSCDITTSLFHPKNARSDATPVARWPSLGIICKWLLRGTIERLEKV